ncbi:unnamed protein product [Closterium sp. Yama58-4]|nr:unnamed protein product [Closterium sp. Yama58-4]
MVWLHGLGDSGNGISNWLNMVWISVAEKEGGLLLDLPHVKWIFPTAPRAPVSVNRGHRAPSWYDIHGFNADAPVDATGLDEAARYIAGILEEERRAHPDVTYIVGGISQGGSLSLYLMCRKALGSFADGSDASALPFIASIGLSTWLPKCSLISAPGETDAAVAERAARHPVFIAHGEVDIRVDYAWGRECSQVLRNAGFSNVTFNSYPNLGHGMCGEELTDMRAWLLQHAPLPA